MEGSILLDIQKSLVGVSTGRHRSEGWTEAIMADLACLAYENDFYVYGQKCHKIDNTITGCLYDMIWYKPMQLDYLPEKNKNSIFGEIFLVLECEQLLGIEEIMYDFQKLVQARAEHRVMIFKSNEIDLIFAKMINYIQSSPHSVPGDRYMLAGLATQRGEFSFKSFMIE